MNAGTKQTLIKAHCRPGKCPRWTRAHRSEKIEFFSLVVRNMIGAALEGGRQDLGEKKAPEPGPLFQECPDCFYFDAQTVALAIAVSASA